MNFVDDYVKKISFFFFGKRKVTLETNKNIYTNKNSYYYS